MSKIADANYTLKATAEEGEAFQVRGVGDSESQLPLFFFFFHSSFRVGACRRCSRRTRAAAKTLARMSYLQASRAVRVRRLRHLCFECGHLPVSDTQLSSNTPQRPRKQPYPLEEELENPEVGNNDKYLMVFFRFLMTSCSSTIELTVCKSDVVSHYLFASTGSQKS